MPASMQPQGNTSDDMQGQLMQQLNPSTAPSSAAPQQSNPVGNTPPSTGGNEQDMAAPGLGDQSQNQQQSPATQALQQRLDSLPDDQKAFLAQYITVPEFVHAVGLISGPDVSQYLSQYVNQDKVLIPVNRQEAQRIQTIVQQQQQQGQGGGQQPQPQPAQGQPQPAQQQAQGKPSMAPAPQAAPQPQMAQAQPSAQQLPNGVTPAPMQHGIMAPQA